MAYKSLKKRIQKNEGFSIKAYKDKLGNLTIGYGHLIKKKWSIFKKQKPNTPMFVGFISKRF